MSNATLSETGLTRAETRPRRRFRLDVGWLLFMIVIGLFALNMIGLVGSVVVNSFATSWFGTLWPEGLTTRWYTYAAGEHNISQLLGVTLLVAVSVVGISMAIGLPAAYVMARRDFRGKNWLMTLYLLPMLVPPMTYGIPLATALYRWQLGGSVIGVILANLVPVVPFMILILTPFIEQIDVNLESAARMLGAGRAAVFRRVLLPLVLPGLLTAGILALVRTVAMFELTFLTSSASSQTLVVALYYDAFAAGIRPQGAIDAMAVLYAVTVMAALIVALRFVSPTQMVFRVRE